MDNLIFAALVLTGVGLTALGAVVARLRDRITSLQAEVSEQRMYIRWLAQSNQGLRIRLNRADLAKSRQDPLGQSTFGVW